MILLVQSNELYNNDLRAMLMAFYPGEKLTVMKPVDVAIVGKELHNEFTLCFTALYDEKRTLLKIEEKAEVKFYAYVSGPYEDRKVFRNRLKLAAYQMLSEFTGRTLPWGSLTGVRPTKIAIHGIKEGESDEDIITEYERRYAATTEKAEFALKVAKRETAIFEEEDIDVNRDYALYIHIPFCPSRCLYCSFASFPIQQYKYKVPEYLAALSKELQFISYVNRDRRLVSIYVGGGTPTALGELSFDNFLTEAVRYFDTSHLKEYTVEAGRPDSITERKLEIMKAHGVTRISINPQTMNDSTLKVIGRAHTADDFERAFRLAKEYKFDNINTDIIAGLPMEKLKDMENTLDVLRRMRPESLTVHSLAIKRAAHLSEELTTYQEYINHDAKEMQALAAKYATYMGMKPYYMYRQKNIAGNLENVGYSKPGRECLYNMLIMEEKTDIFGAGAGASTKLVNPGKGNVERIANSKSVDDYIVRIEDMLDKKRDVIGNTRINE
ncbi:coproporphyrinogen dehydrogenase HemZ [Eubacterium ruminantium]|uniref:coproporphyrinogen dehydrogenase HemZ n=1 Tax=Eubacterium ruminantium TaxID=42322 RepID=UPI001569F839|nr:coproporphyrinogen dehydrogenase HemZ [Eubacterium ruminantium]